MTTLTAKQRAEQLFTNDKLCKKKVEACLVLEDYSAKDIKEALAEYTTKPKTFASEYYDWLSAKKRTTKQATDYIMGKGEYGETSDNVKKHKSHYLNIAELTIKVWASK